ncbi:MAG: lysophospholipid acyltransferase family protein [Verrucomicrobia bacterium]|nr:lysophospholipid acyltransferase family protein [Deltaproteobacteria bacterium]
MKFYSNLNLLLIKLFTILVPRWLFPPFTFFWGGLFYLLLTDTRRAVRSNLRVVTGRDNVERLVFSTFRKFSHNWCDEMLLMRLRGEKLQAMIGRRSSSETLDQALATGSGAILVSPHLGSWELGGLGLADLGYTINMLTYREPDEKVNELREAVRLERGINFIYVDRDDSSPLAIIEAVNALRRNEVLAILGDRDGSSNTILIDFFGRPTNIPVGAAYLALASGAPVIPVFVLMEEKGRYATIMEEPIFFSGGHGEHDRAIRSGMERLLAVFEQYILAYPDQWYNLYDFFGRDRESDTTKST